ncbi:MAG: TonB-dependent receptor plug domain-containing protein, partial [Bacteroidetes bacterium]|nr:TonB-dependent receptor plug domain-containing protein [Bacteroidota bacterium]
QVGTFEIPIEKVKTLPAFLGEVDILKTIQLTPGVQSAGEGNSGFYVRGGGPDQNLILLDEGVVYNASHLFGFFSVFNADAIKNVELTKAGMPANYGGRLASVLDISMKDGNNKSFHGTGGIGLISSRLTLEGPIQKDRSSFIVSGRRTYIDVLMKPFVKETSPFKGSGYYFYDLNAKANYIFSDKDRLFVSGYFGRDIFSLVSGEESMESKIQWGNGTLSSRWNHLFNDQLFSNTTAIFSDYSFAMDATLTNFDFKLFTAVRDYNLKSDFTYLGGRHTVKFGANYIYHIFTPNNASFKSGDVDFDLSKDVELFAHDAAIYINDEFDLSEKIRFNAGVRGTMFTQVGPFSRFVKNEVGQITDTTLYGPNESVATYTHAEPRLSVRWITSKTSSVKAAYTQNYQYIHLASVSAVSLPSDIWVPSSELVEPQFGTQYSIGYFRNFKENMFETSFEVYYKDLKNQIEFAEGAMPEDNVTTNADNSFVYGNGWSYGAELFLKKRKGKLNGWIGYTLSYTKRKFPEVNGGKEFYAKYDRRHDVSFIASYDFNDKLTVSLVWVYATGNAITLPISRYFLEGNVVNEYSDRNSFRMPPYHRMDFSVNYVFEKKKRWQHSLNFSVYNLYNRYNPYFIYFETTGNVNEMNLEVAAKQVSLFPILPSITWNFNF